jgi:hypothetical protein
VSSEDLLLCRFNLITTPVHPVRWLVTDNNQTEKSLVRMRESALSFRISY